MNKKRRSASGAYQELGQTLLRLSKLKQTSHYSHLQNDRPDHEILIYTELHLTVFSSQATSVSPVQRVHSSGKIPNFGIFQLAVGCNGKFPKFGEIVDFTGIIGENFIFGKKNPF